MLKQTWSSLRASITRFNEAAAAWWPGAKLKALAAATTAASAGLLIIQSFDNIDLKPLIGDYAPYVGIAFGLLSFWFRELTNVANDIGIAPRGTSTSNSSTNPSTV